MPLSFISRSVPLSFDGLLVVGLSIDIDLVVGIGLSVVIDLFVVVSRVVSDLFICSLIVSVVSSVRGVFRWGMVSEGVSIILVTDRCCDCEFMLCAGSVEGSFQGTSVPFFSALQTIRNFCKQLHQGIHHKTG